MSGKSFRVSDGDWICPDKKCGNVNFARRTSCNRCGREKTTEAKMMKAGGTEIGKTLAEKSRGLFSANDWQCKTCGNVNWARRSECNMCNTPKYAKLEERTGYGGGFNERENVEYIEREESDGEYDEFGRKKKKYRGKTNSTSSSKSEKKEVPKVAKEEDEEEEEEEDGDVSKYKLDDEDDEDDEDGDLSKYDLDASDEEDKPAKKKGSRSGSSRSSSRSSSSSSRSRSRSRSRSSSSSRSGSRSRSHSRSSSRSGKGSSPRKRSRSPSSSPERGQKRSRSRSSSGGRKRRRSRSHSSERFGFLWNTTMALIVISHQMPRLSEFIETFLHFDVLRCVFNCNCVIFIYAQLHFTIRAC
ncbi:zinc finger Ran-binding domain-containing protein 2 isoform X1 [Solea senegalensis]|uniref:Zinc finger Ran-binding domain-containing protein 2 n=3 Tax=Solea senegalensis TaxID=28829 RepID=A0AAV6S9Z9_SOLSE|nr:zinc finger Ran-binding domain-containing protein 2 isoform X1 [Solea senegalensis]KAG7514154.1 zinc finger Ran-binding domain-containing protein 2 isoform X1 [Solea senegalensis]